MAKRTSVHQRRASGRTIASRKSHGNQPTQRGSRHHATGERARVETVVRAASSKPTAAAARPLTHEERVELINKPFPTFRVIDGSKGAGVGMGYVVPINGHRVGPMVPDDYEEQQ